jgi:hypothetical protein
MEMEGNAGIEALRLRAQNERALITELNARLGPELNERLKLASDLLDDVEAFFVDAELLQEPNAGIDLARWLAVSERTLERAVKVREHVKVIIDKFGPHAKMERG